MRMVTLFAASLLWSIAPAQAAPSVAVLRAIQNNQFRLATQQIREALVDNPDDPDLHALQGLAWSRSTLFADALGAFAFADGRVRKLNHIPSDGETITLQSPVAGG